MHKNFLVVNAVNVNISPELEILHTHTRTCICIDICIYSIFYLAYEIL